MKVIQTTSTTATTATSSRARANPIKVIWSLKIIHHLLKMFFLDHK